VSAVGSSDGRLRRVEWVALATALVWGAAIVIGAIVVPLAGALVTGCALWRRAGEKGAGAFAWAVTGLLACFNLLAILSIGVYVVPVTVALVVACAAHGGKPRALSTSPGTSV
jgi:hypothetical protein